MSKVAIGLIVLALAGAAMCQESQGPFFCDYRTRDQKCYTQLPICKKFSYNTDPQNMGKYEFICQECEQGYEPIPLGVSNLDLSAADHLPQSLTPVHLCRRVEAKDPVYCSHPACRAEIPQCQQYTLTDVVEREGPSGTTIRFGNFLCKQCTDLFQPVSDTPKQFELNPLQPKMLCKRRMGASECGVNCQSEMPGCVFYTASKPEVRNSQSGQEEYAQFYCAEPEPGYESVMTLNKYNTNPNSRKEIAIREYESYDIDCEDLRCRHVFRNCLVYDSISRDDDYNEYICHECRAGFKPRKLPVVAEDYYLLYAEEKYVSLCDAQPLKSVASDIDWEEEMPGCLKITVSDVKFASDGIQVAVYKCEQCADGYEPIDISDPVPVVFGWNLAKNVKPRCRPKAKPEPTVCDDKCRQKLRFCQEYTLTYDPNQAPWIESFTCTKCDDGFVPTQSPDKEPWFYNGEKHVCKRVATPDQIECGELCQENFPNCEQVSISVDPNGHNVYWCHQCAQGFFPINYEDPTPGRLSAEKNPMRNYNTIYLCSEDANELYLSKTDCDASDVSIFDSAPCHNTVNCIRVIEVRNLMTGQVYDKCLQCGQGFRPKTKRPRFYDIDQSLCEKIPKQATKSE